MMSTVLPQAQSAVGGSRPPDEQVARSRYEKWLVPLFWVLVAVLLIGAVIMRLYHLDVPFDRDSYDEGVYWQSLRAMLAGQSLYHTIFYSQPPAFLLSVFPGFALFGGSLWSARFGLVLVSLLGFLGAYLLGKSLAGRMGVLVALLLLLVNPLYLAESQTLQAEAPSMAFTLLAIGFAFLWWKYPDGWRGVCWASLAGITLALSIFSKLLLVSTLIPIFSLMLARVWQIWRKQPGTNKRSWLPMLAGSGFALLASLLIVLPFLGSFQDFWSGVVTFHEVAAKTLPGTVVGNLHIMKPTLFSALGATAFYGTLTACLRRDWRVLPLLAWLLATIFLLARQYPLFNHHMIALEPPFIALAILGVVEPAYYKEVWLAKFKLVNLAPYITALAILLILGTSVVNMQQDINYYNSANANSVSASTLKGLQVAADLRQVTTPDQWVITDGQFIAGLADRDVPPALVDTSGVRIDTGYVTLAQLEQAASNPRVHAVLFYTGRFYLFNVNGFHAWVALHFHIFRTYGSGQELWVR
jgi:4-amino-4-deoxy-L-arabinose transferase-like glycosyltransferase